MRKIDPHTVEYYILSTNLSAHNKILKLSIRIAKSKHYQNIFNIYSGNVKTRKKTISDEKDVANKCNAYITTIGSNLADKIKKVPQKLFSAYLVSKPITKFEFQPVEIKEVNKIISQLDSKRIQVVIAFPTYYLNQ